MSISRKRDTDNFRSDFTLDNKIAREFRERLRRYLDDLRTDNAEIAEGLVISRPTITDFMNASNDQLTLPPVTPSKIVSLWKALTEEGKLNREAPEKNYRRRPGEKASPEEIRDNAIKQRKLLKQRGPDELLIAAGFLPIEKQWISVSRERYPQLLKLALLLDNNIVTFDQFIRFTHLRFEELNAAFQEYEAKKTLTQEEIEEIIRSTIDSHPTIDWSLRNKLLHKFDRAQNRIRYEGLRKQLRLSEIIPLFAVILINETTAEEHLDLKLRILNYNIQNVSCVIANNPQWTSIFDDLLLIGREIEQGTLYLKDSQTSIREPNNLDSIQPVIRVEVICSCSFGTEKHTFCFTHTSNNSPTANGIIAVARNLGFRYSLSNLRLENHFLGCDLSTLVKSTAIIHENQLNNNAYFQGDWVDRDWFKAVLQSVVIAGEKLLTVKVRNIQRKTFINILLTISRLRKELQEIYIDVHNYQINSMIDGITTGFTEQALTQESLERVASEAQQCLKQFPKGEENDNALEALAVNLYRIYFMAKLHILRIQIMRANLSRTVEAWENLCREINEAIASISKPICYELQPTQVLIHMEGHLLHLSAGDNMSLFNTDGVEWFENIKSWVRQMRSSIQISDLFDSDSFDRDLDSYHAIGNTYSISGRWLMYLGSKPEHLYQAIENFLGSAYSFLRVGLEQRAARDIVLVGRSYIRLKQADNAKQCIELATYLVERTLPFREGQRQAYEQGLFSEIYLLKGEYNLLLKQHSLGLEEALKGLKGAIWLGLSRRIADNLYCIYRCAETLDDQQIEGLLKSVFPVLWKESDQEKQIRRLNPNRNKTAHEVLNLIFDLHSNHQSSSWHKVGRMFREKSIECWNSWHCEATGRSQGIHPISTLIKKGIFLQPVIQ